jgi:S1-C subfamily serine protease
MRERFPNETGVLVAEAVLPKGPAHEKLEEGDVLLKVNGELVSQFIRLDDILDSSVSQSVTLVIQRGGQDIEVEIEVGDLHEITPDRFVQVAGATFHDLSYQQARLYAISIKGNGVYVCETGGTFRLEGSESGWMIQSVNNQDTPDLNAFIKVMTEIPDRSRVVIAYKHLRDLHTRNTAIINVDRHWHKKMRLAVRNDKTGLWDFSDLSDPVPAIARSPQRAKFIAMSNEKYPQAVEIIKSFVRVTCLLPVKLDGFPRGRKTGYGLVVDAEKGLVVISRAIVPYDMCDIHITIADSIQVPGKVLFMHPLQNFAVIQYDAKLVDADVQSARLSKDYVKQGQEIVFFGFNQNYRPVTVPTTITDITTVAIPATTVTPRYRAVNIDAITVDTNLAAQCGSGVLMNDDGTVQALWMTYLGDRSGHSGKDVEYHLGLQTPMILPVIDQIQAGVIPDLRMLNVELHTCPMDHARILGVPEGAFSPFCLSVGIFSDPFGMFGGPSSFRSLNSPAEISFSWQEHTDVCCRVD